jgi:hypothetical protein
LRDRGRVGGLCVGRADRQRRATSPPHALRKWASVLAGGARHGGRMAVYDCRDDAALFARIHPPLCDGGRPRAGLPASADLVPGRLLRSLDGVCAGRVYRRHAAASIRRCVALADDARGADTGWDARSRRLLSVLAAQGRLSEIVPPSRHLSHASLSARRTQRVAARLRSRALLRWLLLGAHAGDVRCRSRAFGLDGGARGDHVCREGDAVGKPSRCAGRRGLVPGAIGGL